MEIKASQLTPFSVIVSVLVNQAASDKFLLTN
jgi:hypothetical protein